MKQLILLTASTVLLSVSSPAAPCAPGTLASYMVSAAAGCTLGNLTVSGFTYKASATGGAVEITPDQIMVEPLLAPVGSFGLQFSAPWRAVTGQTQGSVITYKVMAQPTTTPPGNTIKELMLNGSGFTGGLITSAIVTEGPVTSAAVSPLQVYEKCKGATVCQTKTTAKLELKKPAAAMVVSDNVALTAKQGATTVGDFADWFVVCQPCVN